MLTEYYNDRARVEKLLELGDLSILREKIDPAPDRRHGFDFNEQQKDVCVFYGDVYKRQPCRSWLWDCTPSV